jgi:hypothetical protein
MVDMIDNLKHFIILSINTNIYLKLKTANGILAG